MSLIDNGDSVVVVEIGRLNENVRSKRKEIIFITWQVGILAEKEKQKQQRKNVQKQKKKRPGEKKEQQPASTRTKIADERGRKNVISSDDGKFFLHSLCFPACVKLLFYRVITKIHWNFSLSDRVFSFFTSPTRDTILMNFQVPCAIRQKRGTNCRIWSYVLDFHSILRSLFLNLNNVVLVFKI